MTGSLPPDALPVAVIGVGRLGERHARIYHDLPQARLVGVADLDEARARTVAEAWGCRAVTDFRELLPEIRAASVAVPTSDHHPVACELIDAGIDVLVEKPIAGGAAEGREMIERARRAGRKLAVGHTERYNPAVEALFSLSEEPRFIEVHRLGSFSPRSLDIDVVLDLMIHDLDVVTTLVGRSVESIEAVGVPVLTPRVDIANARLRFEGGAVANLTASRVSQDKTRKLRVFERARYLSVDYAEQEALSYRLVPTDGGRPEIRREALDVGRREPLREELSDFLESVRTDREPRVNGEAGLDALDLALRIIASMEAPS